MTNQKNYLITELIILFVLIPILLASPIPSFLKPLSVLTAIGYCIVISRKNKLITFKAIYQINFKEHWKRISITAICVFLASLFFMYLFHPDDLFIVVKKSPLMWFGILFFYAIFSVYPQELAYRSYFFTRYDSIFKNKNYLLLINILVFPIAHLMFNNMMVLLVTLIGGILFTITYNKSKSLLLTSIEHAIYGNWLFTIGMGEMLAFPIPS